MPGISVAAQMYMLHACTTAALCGWCQQGLSSRSGYFWDVKFCAVWYAEQAAG